MKNEDEEADEEESAETDADVKLERILPINYQLRRKLPHDRLNLGLNINRNTN